jgi:hypothetical protein
MLLWCGESIMIPDMTSERELAERDNDRATKNRERFIFRPARRVLARLEKYNGAVTAAATVVISCLTVSMCVDSGRQAETARDQFKIMSGQLEEMKVQSAITRNQVKAYLTFSYGKTSARNGIFVTPTFKNTGGSEAINFKGWDDKRLFSPPFPNDFDFTARRTNDPLFGQSIGRDDARLLPSLFVTFDEMKKIVAGQGWIIVWGRTDFDDLFKTHHHTNFCFSVTVNPDASDLSLMPLKNDCNITG